jgi:REP element-mobilizing transposase RayT
MTEVRDFYLLRVRSCASQHFEQREDVFTRTEYKDILLNSFRHCQQEKGLVIYAYVIMSNHFHLLIGKEKTESTFSDIIRDLKKYTAMQLIKSIKENPQESRREWMMEMFSRAGNQNSQNTTYQFWQQNNQPTQLNTSEKINNALDYIHNNPVSAGWVADPEEYLYSSARNYYSKESRLKITSIFDGPPI